MRLTFLVATLLLAAALWAQQAPKVFESDARLKAPITMRAKIVSLADFTAELQKLTKVRFAVADDIADRKITAIFHDRPTAELMGAVQNAMFMEWKKVGDGYRLTLPVAVDREEQGALSAEIDAFQSGLLKALQGYAKNFGLSKDEIGRRDAEIKAKIAELQSDSSPNASDPVTALRDERSQLHSIGGNALCAQHSGDLQGVVDSLIAGKTVFASTRPEDGGPTLPPGFMDHVHGYMPDALYSVVLMRLNPEQQMIEGETVSANSSTRAGNMMGDFFSYHPLAHNPPDMKSLKLIARLQKWQGQSDPTVLDKAVTLGGKIEEKPGYVGTLGTGFTLAEHLEFLADHADIPVVGDAFRTFCSRAEYRSETSIRGYIDGLKKSKLRGRSSPASYFASSGGWLLARHDDYWRRQVTEVPEALLLPLEAAAKNQEFPTVDDYARFAGGLSVAQVNALQYSTMGAALRFDALPLQDTLASLRLWSTLTPAQIAVAKADGFALTNLSPPQARIVLDGWTQKMWRGGIQANIWASMFSPSGLADARPIFKFHSFEDNRPRAGEGAGARRPRTGAAASSRRPGGGSGAEAWQRGYFEYDLGQNVTINEPFVLSPVRP